MYEIVMNSCNSIGGYDTFAEAWLALLDYIRDAEQELGGKCRLENDKVVIDYGSYETEYGIQEY